MRRRIIFIVILMMLFGPGVQAQESAPDIVIQNMRIEREAGGSCSTPATVLGVRLTVTNLGEAAAGAFAVEVNGAREVVAGLPAGQSVSLFFAGYLTGAENRAVVDVDDQLAEADETNNEFVAMLPVPTPVPTCTPTAPVVTPTATATVAPSTPRLQGRVVLQGRTNYSGTVITDAQGRQVTTDAEGNFTLVGELPLTVSQPRYLGGSAGPGEGVRTPGGEGQGTQVELGQVTLLAGDINQDNTIDIFDLVALASTINTDDLTADIDNDGQVTIRDVALAASNYQAEGPVMEWSVINE